MKLEDTLKGILKGKFRVIKMLGTAVEENYSVFRDYEDREDAIEQASLRNDLASENCRQVYFYVVNDKGEIIFPED